MTWDFERLTLYSSDTTTNPTSQLASYATDTIAHANSGYFCLPAGHTPLEIKYNQVVVKKESRVEEGSKQFTSNYTTVTEALNPGFGAEISILFK